LFDGFLFVSMTPSSQELGPPANPGRFRQFLVCGVDKVKSIALMHGLTHNMVCGWRLIAI
jgi:hypothetical protein